MSYLYFEVLRKIQSNLSVFILAFLQFLQILFYGLVIELIMELQKLLDQGKSPYPLIYNVLIIFFFARAFSVYGNHKIYLITSLIRETFSSKDLEKLMIEVESSLKNSQEFTKWSCGILTTVLVLIITLFSNIGLKVLDKMIESKSIIDNEKLLEQLSNHLILSSIFILGAQMILLILGIVLGYYFILQLFSYQRKLVLRVLKNSQYEEPYPLEKKSKWERAKLLCQRIFLYDLIKHHL